VFVEAPVANRQWMRLRPVRTPDWHAMQPTPAPDAATAFSHTSNLTVGLEEETMLLDAATLDVAPAAEDVLRALGGDGRFTRELRDGQLEIVTPVAGNAHAAGLHLAQARLDLQSALDGRIRVAVAGTHPFSMEWGNVANEARYEMIAEEFAWAALGNVPCGIHVHVGIGGPERALAVFNAARSYLPEIAALAANSPFADGVDTGLASARRPLNESFHRSGVPPAFESWAEFDELVAWGRTGGLFPDATHFWWDLRPHPRFGTLELRICDAQTRVEDEVALAAVFQSLVAWLAERHDLGETLPVDATVRIRENAWRAVRYGVRGWMADLQTGEPQPTRDRISALLDRIERAAERLGNGPGLLSARALVADNGADLQRYVGERHGLVALTRWLADQTTESAADYLMRRS
jgi:glutamate---cysteine ligase / carboxylate-amine ligase